MKILRIYWPYILLSYACLFSLGLLDNGRGPYFPDLVMEFGLNDTQAGLFFAVPALMAFLGSFAAPKWIDKFGALRILRLGMLSMFLGYVGIALSGGWGLVLCGAGLFGLGLGILGVGQHIIIQQGAPVEARRRLFSGLHSIYAFSSLLAPLAITGMIVMGWGWRTGFLILSIVAALVLFASFKVEPHGEYIAPEMEKSPKGMRTHLIYVGVLVSLYVQAELILSSRLVLYVRRELDFPKEMAPQFLTAFFISLLVGRLLFTFFHFKFLSHRQVVLGSLAGSLLLFLLGLEFNPWFLALSAFTMGPFFPYSMDYVSDVFGKHAGRGIGYCISISSLMVVFMHFFLGYMSDLVGLSRALYMGPIGLSFSLIMLLLHPLFFKGVREATDSPLE